MPYWMKLTPTNDEMFKNDEKSSEIEKINKTSSNSAIKGLVNQHAKYIIFFILCILLTRSLQ